MTHPHSTDSQHSTVSQHSTDADGLAASDNLRFAAQVRTSAPGRQAHGGPAHPERLTGPEFTRTVREDAPGRRIDA